jgi:NAD(P)-dependent dehydrogenase (short-subunit alcohol dehydrogenase family)
MLVSVKSQLSKDRNRVVLVTGGAIRIGAAIAEELAKAGWNVVVHAYGSGLAADTLCERLRGYGVCAWRVTADLAHPHAAKGLFEEARMQAGRLDALVNNAALFSLMKELSEQERERLLNVNTDVPIQLTCALFDHLRERQAQGSVVNLLDQRIARVAMETATPYEESKLLLAQATVAEALALAPVLRINAVAPGAVLCPTAVTEKEPAGHIPLGRRPTPADVASAVCWLLESESITGQTLYVDGGQHLI